MIEFIFLLFFISNTPCVETVELRGIGNDGPPPLPYNPNDLYTPQVINTAVHGLHKCFDCQNIAVVGAGTYSHFLKICLYSSDSYIYFNLTITSHSHTRLSEVSIALSKMSIIEVEQ
jgi:hypothetical protein